MEASLGLGPLCVLHSQPHLSNGYTNEACSQVRWPALWGTQCSSRDPPWGWSSDVSPTPGPLPCHNSHVPRPYCPHAKGGCLLDSLGGTGLYVGPPSFQVLSQSLGASLTLTPTQSQHGSKSPEPHLPINAQSGHAPPQTAAPRPAPCLSRITLQHLIGAPCTSSMVHPPWKPAFLSKSWAPKTKGMLLSQGLCTCHSCYLECSSPQPSPAPVFSQSATPLQKGLLLPLLDLSSLLCTHHISLLLSDLLIPLAVHLPGH